MFRIFVIAAAVALCAASAPAVVWDLTPGIRPVPVEIPWPGPIRIPLPDIKPFPLQFVVKEGGCIRTGDPKGKGRWSDRATTGA